MKRCSKTFFYISSIFYFFLSRGYLFAQELSLGNAASLSAAGQGAQSALGGNASASGFSFEELGRVPEGRALLAATTPDYPVTPGDIYTLSFLKSSDTANISLVVQNDFLVNLGVFGTMSGRDLSFVAFKSLVEKKVASAYPGSSPVLIIRSTGVFTVKAEGQVKEASLIQAWALERLASVVQRIKTTDASERSVLVRSASGAGNRYDLFTASRMGDLRQNPYVRPGDTIVLAKIDRRVTVAGSVYRPGTYELIPSDGIREIVEFYGEGLKKDARAEYASIERRADKDNPEGAALFFDASFPFSKPLPGLYDGDTIFLPSRETYLPVIYFEGAIATGTEVARQYAMDRQPFKFGDKLSRSLRKVATKIAPGADLRRAFIARKSQADTIPVDLEKLLYAYDPRDDIALKPEDRIVIPFGNLDVFVTGEVTKSAWVNTAALTRLSAAVLPLVTKYSSLRDIAIRNEGGEEKHYDLFLAERDGNREQDPFLKPGDMITVSRLQRSVTIAGEVKRPGTYQLLDGEGIAALISRYGEGLTREARGDFASLVKKANEQNPDGGMVFFDATQLGAKELPPLSDGDEVAIPSRESFLPVIYFEGAIASGTETAKQYATDRQPFKPGDRLARSLKMVAARLAPTADLRRAFIARKSQADTIPVDLEKLLYAYDPKDDIELQAEDRIVIPFGNLDVFVTGEVTKSSWVNTAALTRLSSAVTPLLTKYSSIRDIAVRNEGGEEKRYDLFRAERDGDREQDPFLKPGDVITVGRLTRSVTVTGEVKRPGTYQLLEGEGVAELIQRYGEGPTREARADFASVVKKANEQNPDGGAVFFDATKLNAPGLPSLTDGDVVTLPSRESYLPVIYFEGAIASGTEAAKQYATDRQPFKPGDRLARSLKLVAAKLAPTADLRRAFIARKSQADTIPVDLEKLLYAYDPKDDIELQAEDRIVIPFGNLDVFVTGEVTKSSWVNTAALTRLSSAVTPLLTKYSSVRDIAVRNEGGEEKRYDLFRAERDGDREQDPFLKPGDVITVGRLTRSVTVAGEVKRPGIYQLLDGEGVADLIQRYGEGPTREARADFASVVKKANEQNPDGGAVFFDAMKLNAIGLPPLTDGDVVTLPSRESYLPVIYFEGAIAAGTEAAKQYATDRQPFKPGDRLARSLKLVAARLAPTADLRRAFIARKSQADTIPVDLEKLLYAYDPKDDIELQAEDRIVIPFGNLDVFVTGEVTKSSWVNTAALTRLSSAVTPLLTKYSSIRDIAVRNEGGEEKRYDLFRAERDGDREQDPFLKPGDVVTVGRLIRSVTVGGEVKRPGTYQLLEGDGIRELVERYAQGLSREARADFASLTRRANEDTPEGGALFFDAMPGTAASLPALEDGDSVFVPHRDSYLPVIYYEGAIAAGTEAGKQYNLDRQPFRPGDRLSRSLREVAKRISPAADLKRALIARKGNGEKIPVDLEKILYAYSPEIDIELQAEDRIVIPFGNLDVFVTGEVLKSSWIGTGSLTRLSAAISPLLTRYSSIRDVLVTSADGQEHRYDLFRAERYGELEQDPYLISGDRVTVERFQVAVAVGGEVKRPGTYQLLPGEGLTEAIEVYANGFTDQADPSRIAMTRSPFTGFGLGQMQYLDYASAKSLPVFCYDSFSVPSLVSLRPVVYFEGAVRTAEGNQALASSDRISYQFVPGEMLSHASQALRKGFSAESDLANSYVIRAEKRIPVNIADYIYNKDFTKDLELAAGDIVIVPFRQFFVSVSGAVKAPGRYPYIPDRAWDYYIGLAGGFDEELNAGKAISIVDVAGRKKAKAQTIEPEDTITAPSNSFLYVFNKVSGILTTVVSVASLVLALMRL